MTAEGPVIGGLLIDGAALVGVQAVLRAEDFESPRWREVYAAMLALDARGLAVDCVTVCAELEARGTLERVGEGNLTASINLCPVSLHVLDYAAMVARRAQRRRAEQLAAYALPRTGAVVE